MNLTTQNISHEGAKAAKAGTVSPSPTSPPSRDTSGSEKLGSVNPTPLFCRSAVREFILDAAKAHRPFNKFSRVSEATMIAVHSQLRQLLVARVKSAPSKGVTL